MKEICIKHFLHDIRYPSERAFVRAGTLHDSRSGQSILEIIVAVALFSFIASAMVSLATGGFIGLTQGGEQTQAAALTAEGMEAVRAIHDDAWNRIIYSTSSVATSSGVWTFSGEGTTEVIGQFMRTISFEDVCRDASDGLVDCPGTYTDPHSKLVTASVIWDTRDGISNTVKKISYLTNWDSRDWTQTDWSGGSGQSEWSDTTKYDSGTNVDDDRGSGQLESAEAAEGSWSISDGTEVTETSDTDFSGGTFSTATTTGSGDGTSIVLTQTASWTEHASSTVVTNKDTFGIDAVSSSDVWAVANSGETIHWDGTSWSAGTDVGDRLLFAVSMNTTSDGWAVANVQGEIYNYDGTSWSLHTDTGNEEWFDVTAISTSDVWVIGKEGKAAQYNGVSWTESTIGNKDLNGIDSVSSSDIWAVGKNGTLFNYNGTSWSAITSPTSNTLNDVEVISANDVWAVGDSGTIIHYDGSGWTSTSSPTGNKLRSISAVSSSNVWAVGDSGTIIQYDGTSWSTISSPAGNTLYGVAFVSSSDGWAVGAGGLILQYSNVYESSGTFESGVIDSGKSGTDWATVRWTETLPTGSDLTVATRSGDTATVDVSWSSFGSELTTSGGSTIDSASSRYIQYRLTLTRATNPGETSELDDITISSDLPSANTLNDLDIVSASEIWAVGDSGAIISYNGTSWLAASSPTGSRLRSIDMVSESLGFAVGDGGIIISYSGTSWSTATTTGDALRSVYAVSASDIWTVGDAGKIWHYGGATWSEHTDTGSQTWNSVTCVSSSDCWLVGNQGLIYQYNGTSWSQNIDTGDSTWESVHCLDTSRCWASSNQGLIYEWNGTSWSQDVDSGSDIWNGIVHVDSHRWSEGWAVGVSGVIYFDDNETGWTSLTSPTSADINAVAMVSAISGWAVGKNGTILRFTRTALFESEGTLTSSAFDMSDASPAQIIEWDEVLPGACGSSCTVMFEVSTAPDSSGSPGTFTSWYGSTTVNSFFTHASGTLISTDLNGNEWMRYRATLNSDGIYTPFLEEVRVNYK